MWDTEYVFVKKTFVVKCVDCGKRIITSSLTCKRCGKCRTIHLKVSRKKASDKFNQRLKSSKYRDNTID